MAVTSGFFNSVNGDRLYTAADMTNYFEGLVSDGVYESVGDAMVVKAVGGSMQITVGSGRALALLHWVKNDSALTLDVQPANVQYDRYDSVVVRVDTTEGVRTGTIEIVTGIAAETPSIRPRKNTETTKELLLAAIRVKKGATTIDQSDIVDYRPYTVCGFVTGIVKQVDTSELFLQWQSAYEKFYEEQTAAYLRYVAEKQAYFIQQQQEFDQWFANLTATLRLNTKIVKYQSVQTTTAATTTAPLQIPVYESGDIILLHVGGAMFVEGEEFTIENEGLSATIKFAKTIAAGDTITAICMKSVVDTGGNAIGVAAVETDGVTATVGIAEEV